MSIINNNRKIFIKRTSSEEDTWRNNLSRILEARSTKTFMIGSNLSNDLNVPSSIDLYLTEFPQIEIENQTDRPIKELVSKAKGLAAKTISNYTKGAINGEDVLSALSTATSVVSSVANHSQDTKTASSFSPWVINTPSWKSESHEGLSFSLSFNFSMGMYGLWNAKKEVVLPLLNLLAPVMPQYLSAWTIAGPFATASELLVDSLLNSFSSMKDLWTSNDEDKKSPGLTEDESNDFLVKLGDSFESLILSGYKDYTFTIQFGNFLTLYDVLFTDCNSLKWSNEVDQNGYPIQGKIELKCRGIVPPSVTSSSFRNLALRFGE